MASARGLWKNGVHVVPQHAVVLGVAHGQSLAHLPQVMQAVYPCGPPLWNLAH